MIVITGLAGGIGMAIAAGLKDRYRVVGLDVKDAKGADVIKTDLTSDESISASLSTIRERHGNHIAAVIHLAAYFDFTGEPHPLYSELNVDGTRKLLLGLAGFEVEQFVYAGTMLVHEPTQPGGRIDEDTPIAAKWAYPQSKVEAEAVIREGRGEIPTVILRLAGLYDDRSAVPTIAQQIARIYERDVKSHLYAGDLDAGQAVIHSDDVVTLFRSVVDKRGQLPQETVILAGEEDVMSYAELQNRLGALIHGETTWQTRSVPEPIAKAAAWVEATAEPVVPDAFDQGEKPFIRPFMVDMASDHYALDIARARRLLEWAPRHTLRETLPRIVENLKADPAAWYRRNGITPPDWIAAAEDKVDDLEDMRVRAESRYGRIHFANIWAPWLNLGLGTWLMTSPPLLGSTHPGMIWSDVISGAMVALLAALSLSPRLAATRYVIAAIGCWVMFSPLVFHTANAAVYLNDTLVGALMFSLALLARPTPGPAMVAVESGPTIPSGWDYSPSSWFQRVPIIMLAFIGLYVSRYLAAYQLDQIDGVWEPFFAGSPGDPQNGTEEIITSSVSEAWPVPDAGIGALTYMLEILTGLIGSSRRWRTMPWLVVLFGIMIVPLGVVSITFIVIQPIVIGTWCTLCLIAAAAMLIQIPYSIDELIATFQFLARRKKQGRPLLRVFFTGDTDEGPEHQEEDRFDQSPVTIAKEMLGGGIGLPWNLVACILIGIALMFSRLIVGTGGGMANMDHLIGALVVTVSVTALAEVARAARYANMPLAAALIVSPFVFGTDLASATFSIVAATAIILLSLPRGTIRHHYGRWNRFIV